MTSPTLIQIQAWLKEADKDKSKTTIDLIDRVYKQGFRDGYDSRLKEMMRR